MALDKNKFNKFFNAVAGSYFTQANSALPARKACALCRPLTSGSTVIPGYSRPSSLVVVATGAPCPETIKINVSAYVPQTPAGSTHWGACYTTIASGIPNTVLQVSLASGTNPPAPAAVWAKIGAIGS